MAGEGASDSRAMIKTHGFPKISAAARAAWKKDNGSRRPITLTPQPGTAPTRGGAAPAPTEDPEN